jgi:hypothetical protein
MNNIEVNPNKEYIFGIDISASMTTDDKRCGDQTRYNYMLEKLELFLKTAEDFDEHGAPCVFLFGEEVTKYDHVKLADIQQKLRSPDFEGMTNLHLLLDESLEEHKEKKSELAQDKKVHPGTNLIIFTDGQPTNQAAVLRSIIRIADAIDREDEFNIQILTVGTVDNNLQEYLNSLHDQLEGKTKRDFDIIHVDKLENVNFLQAVSGKLSHATT